MGVYINMAMPKNCPCELVGVGYDLYCSFVHGIPARVREYDECCEKEKRPDWCPLIEVPEPHGDLIDRKSLMEGEGRYFISLCKEGIDVEEILRAKTIIPESEVSE